MDCPLPTAHGGLGPLLDPVGSIGSVLALSVLQVGRHLALGPRDAVRRGLRIWLGPP